MPRKKSNDHFVVFDGGRSYVKALTQSSEVVYDHALAQLTETEYREAITREKDEWLMRINGIPFAVGKRAIKRGYQARMTSANRYNDIYYGSLIAATLYQLYDKPIRDVFVYASHPPSMVQYRHNITTAVKGVWEVDGMHGVRKYKVSQARCFDETVGGVMNLLLSNDGKTYNRSDIKQGDTLTIDIGGQTIDVAPLEDGRIDYTALASADGGIIEVEHRFKKLLRAKHQNHLKSANFLTPSKIRQALASGTFDAGAYGTFDVTGLVRESTEDIIVRINSLIEEYGGLANYNNIVLTGGGGGLLFNRITEYYDHASIIKSLGRQYFHLAEDLEDVHVANVRGGMKLLKMFQKAGKL